MNSWYDGISAAWKNDVGFLQVVSDLSGLLIALWFPGESGTASHWTSGGASEHPCFCNEDLRMSLEQYCRDGDPSIYFETDRIFYGVIPIGPFTLAIGPAVINTVPDEYFLKYSADHSMESTVPNVKINLETMSRYLKLMHYHFMGTAISHEEIPIRFYTPEKWRPVGELEEYQLNQSENDRNHYIGMEFEKDLFQIVKNGDTTMLKSLLTGPIPNYEDIGKISDEQSKETEYLTVSLVTLMTRAAIAGGVRPEVAHEMGDVCLRRLAEAVSRKESILELSYTATIEFVEAVKRSREEKRTLSYMNACKDYIEKNLRKNLQVRDIAPAIGISRTYLSRLFHQEEGITVQQYIQRQKCRHAARMLQYSDYSISQIAQYFGFSSQSYFGSCFQAWYGMSPNAYRKAGREDFIHI